MGQFWRRVLSSLSARRGPPPIKDRFAHFLTICSENDRFLGRLAQLMEVRAGGAPVPRGAVGAGREALCASVGAMVSALVAMAPKRYRELPRRLVALEHELGRRDPAGSTPSFVIWPGDVDADRPEVVGGKGASLAMLAARGGLCVPGFFVVTARAYRHLLEVTGLRDRLAALLGRSEHPAGERAVEGDDPDATLRATCREARRAILEARVPTGLTEMMHGAFGRLRGERGAEFRVAVRSSATVEDSEFSFAGQFETVLDVGEEGLLEAYKRVVASRFRYQAVRYSRMSGHLDDEVVMPVLVMSMVSPVAAGVVYSRDPEGGDAAIVAAVRGLAEPLVSGRVTPQRFVVPRARLREEEIVELRDGGGEGVPLDVGAVARMACALEEHFGGPQDAEWAVDSTGTLCLVQCRPLRLPEPRVEHEPPAEGHRVLLSGGQRACGGSACGRVSRVLDTEQTDAVPAGAVLVVPITSPRLAALVGHVAAIVAEAGSPTGHMATVAREFGVPTIVGAEGAMAALAEGLLVTVDAWTGRVYEGEIALPRTAARAPAGAANDALKRFVDRVAPLLLGDPGSPGFTVEGCQTLHDVARFVHQKGMAEMFAIERLTARERRETRRLRWSIPMEVLVLDLGGGTTGSAPAVELQDIASVPFLALVEGMTDPRVRWSGPVGFDLRGFMSVVVRSAADDQRYGEPSYAICGRSYVHFSSRLAYHFATVDAMCSESENQNYARFVFFGGAAVAERREWRAHFLATVLKHNGFEVSRVRDRVEAVLGKREAGAIEESLVLIGRLMAATRHLDMVMDSQATAEAFAASFLSGDFGFELVRQGLT